MVFDPQGDRQHLPQAAETVDSETRTHQVAKIAAAAAAGLSIIIISSWSGGGFLSRRDLAIVVKE